MRTDLARSCQRQQMATYSVYYMKAEFFRKGLMGYDWLREKSLLPDLADLGKTHEFMKLIEARSLEDVYFKMQARIGVRRERPASLSSAKACSIPQCQSAILRLTTVLASRLSSIEWASGFSGPSQHSGNIKLAHVAERHPLIPVMRRLSWAKYSWANLRPASDRLPDASARSTHSRT